MKKEYYSIPKNMEEFDKAKIPFDPFVISTLIGIDPRRVKGIGWTNDNGKLLSLTIDFDYKELNIVNQSVSGILN